MPSSTFKPISTANLARVFVAILAMDPDDQEMIAEALAADATATKAIREYFVAQYPRLGVPNANNLAKLFDAILSTPKEVREAFCIEFNRVLDVLVEQRADVSYREGEILQCKWDPRGSIRRD